MSEGENPDNISHFPGVDPEDGQFGTFLEFLEQNADIDLSDPETAQHFFDQAQEIYARPWTEKEQVRLNQSGTFLDFGMRLGLINGESLTHPQLNAWFKDLSDDRQIEALEAVAQDDPKVFWSAFERSKILMNYGINQDPQGTVFAEFYRDQFTGDGYVDVLGGLKAAFYTVGIIGLLTFSRDAYNHIYYKGIQIGPLAPAPIVETVDNSPAISPEPPKPLTDEQRRFYQTRLADLSDMIAIWVSPLGFAGADTINNFTDQQLVDLFNFWGKVDGDNISWTLPLPNDPSIGKIKINVEYRTAQVTQDNPATFDLENRIGIVANLTDFKDSPIMAQFFDPETGKLKPTADNLSEAAVNFFNLQAQQDSGMEWYPVRKAPRDDAEAVSTFGRFVNKGPFGSVYQVEVYAEGQVSLFILKPPTIPIVQLVSRAPETPWGPSITGTSYEVRLDDWLSKIAGRAYGDPLQYPVLAEANDISNPDLIYPGQQLVIPR